MTAISGRNVALALLPFLLVGCATMRGCNAGTSAAGDLTEKARHAANHAADNAASIGGLGNIALGFIALGGLALVASFVPVLSTFVPRKAAMASIVFGFSVYIIGGFFAGFMAKFGDAIYWAIFVGLLITGVCAVWPFLVAAYRGTLWMKARELLASGHITEAAAFQITAMPGAAKSPEIRKAVLAKLERQAPPQPPST